MAVRCVVEITRGDRGNDRALCSDGTWRRLIIVGIIVSLTIIGAIVGVPLAIIGLLLVLRGIF